MIELNYNEKIAVLRILKDIALADNIVRESETEYINQVAESYGLSEDYSEAVDNLVTLQALSIIREMEQPKKEEFAKLMGRMIVVDKDINYNEVKMYNTVCESCRIDGEFKTEDYPGYTLSGPFEDAENIM